MREKKELGDDEGFSARGDGLGTVLERVELGNNINIMTTDKRLQKGD